MSHKYLFLLILIIGLLLLGRWLSFHFVKIIVINGGKEKIQDTALKIRNVADKDDPNERIKNSYEEQKKIVKCGSIRPLQTVEKFVFMKSEGIQVEYGTISGLEFHTLSRVFLANPARAFNSIVIPAGVYGYNIKACNGFLWERSSCTDK